MMSDGSQVNKNLNESSNGGRELRFDDITEESGDMEMGHDHGPNNENGLNACAKEVHNLEAGQFKEAQGKLHESYWEINLVSKLNSEEIGSDSQPYIMEPNKSNEAQRENQDQVVTQELN